MTAFPLIDAEAAADVGARAVPPGPHLSAAAVADVVDGLRAALEASVGPVVEVTRLAAPHDGGMGVVDRATWVRLNAAMAATMLAEAVGEQPRPRGVREQLEARANGAQLGLALGVLGSRILGQYLPFAAVPRLVLVAPNVAKAERDLHVDRADFRLWVCLHEQTHRLQFAHAPWLRGHLTGLVAELLEGGEQGGGTDPVRRTGSLVDLVIGPEQRLTFDRVTATMAVLEGYADVMMDRVGPSVVPTVGHIRHLFERRRRRGGWTAVVNRLIGLDLKLAQYRDGAAFCRTVIDRVGVDGLNAVYAEPASLPRPDEIHAPGQWVRRVHG